jgi:hypothetical protein
LIDPVASGLTGPVVSSSVSSAVVGGDSNLSPRCDGRTELHAVDLGMMSSSAA